MLNDVMCVHVYSALFRWLMYGCMYVTNAVYECEPHFWTTSCVCVNLAVFCDHTFCITIIYTYIYSRVSNLKYQDMDLVISPKLILTDLMYTLTVMFIVVSLAVVSGLGTK